MAIRCNRSAVGGTPRSEWARDTLRDAVRRVARGLILFNHGSVVVLDAPARFVLWRKSLTGGSIQARENTLA
jgi:hypothetical protein